MRILEREFGFIVELLEAADTANTALTPLTGSVFGDNSAHQCFLNL